MSQNNETKSKIVVFDMDETLGYFVEFGIFWEVLNSYIKEYNNIEELDQKEFNIILDLYPEFIRPNIYSILNYLKYKKISHECHDIMIYTNNQGPPVWPFYVKEYFENKIKYKLFDKIIRAFKINGKQIEISRTTHDKTYKDFIKCSKIPINTQICFLDDTYYPEMKNENVYYIKLKPYVYNLSYDTLLERFISSGIGRKIVKNDNVDNFYDFMLSNMNNYNLVHELKKTKDYEIDKIITKKIMVHLQTFFKKIKNLPANSRKTKLNNQKIKNKTLKRSNSKIIL